MDNICKLGVQVLGVMLNRVDKLRVELKHLVQITVVVFLILYSPYPQIPNEEDW